MSDEQLRLRHPPRKCGDGSRCNGAVLEARIIEPGLHQSDGWLAGAVYECKPCEWRSIVPLADGDRTTTTNGWTASVSPCRRATDVQPV